MASKSLARFKAAQARSLRLLLISTDSRLRPVSYVEAEPALHAALAAMVSAWEAYVESVVPESLDEIARGANAELMSVLLLLKEEAVRAIERFNTPNAENCRELILRYTGFDTFPIMASGRLRLPAHLARSRLNEVLKVRHSFAHGFQIPTYGWTTRYGVTNRLTKKGVQDAALLIQDFVVNVDAALSAHLKVVFPGRAFW